MSIHYSIVRWNTLNCSTQVAIAYTCSHLTRESADGKAVFFVSGKRLTTVRCICPVSSLVYRKMKPLCGRMYLACRERQVCR